MFKILFVVACATVVTAQVLSATGSSNINGVSGQVSANGGANPLNQIQLIQQILGGGSPTASIGNAGNILNNLLASGSGLIGPGLGSLISNGGLLSSGLLGTGTGL